MAIFSRRSIQEMIFENARWLPAAQTDIHVSRLNDPQERNVLAYEWEVAILFAASKLGKVIYEPGEGRKPDMLWTPFQSQKTLVADITTISDEGIHKNNPYERLYEELHKRTLHLNRHGRIGTFALQVREVPNSRPHWRGPAKLQLPPEHRFKTDIFNSDFYDFLRRVGLQPQIKHSYTPVSPAVDLTITFEPGAQFWGGGHPVFDLPKSSTDNALFRALKEKAQKFKGSGLQKPFAVFVCDAGCSFLSRKPVQLEPVTVRGIVDEFFRQSSTVDLVGIYTVRKDQFGSGNPLRLEAELYSRRDPKSLDPKIATAVENLHSHLPIPVRSSRNARYYLDGLRRTNSWDKGGSHIGGMMIHGNKIRLSSRAVLALMSGELDSKSFRDAHGSHFAHFFERMSREGRLIRNVTVIKDKPTTDDDWLEIEFGDVDPAVSPFRSSLING